MTDSKDIIARLGLRQKNGQVASNVEIVYQENRTLEHGIIFTEKQQFQYMDKSYDVEKPIKVKDMVAVWQRRGYVIVYEDSELVILATDG